MIKSLKNYGILFLIISFCLLSGCATLQSPYPEKMAQTKTDLTKNEPQKAEAAYKGEFSSKTNPNLYLMELGRLNQLSNQPKQSLNNYTTVITAIANDRMKAKIQVSKMFSNASAIATSDLELDYDIPDFEQTFLYAYQAKNYLSLKDLSNAVVSIRQLSQAQSWIQRQKNITAEGKKKINDDYAKYNINDQVNLDKHKQIATMQAQVKNIANSYENGFAYYLESILYEAFDYDYNDAFISIKNAYRLLPDNQYVTDTYKQMQIGFNGGNPFGQQNGRLVIITENGLVEAKKAFEFPLILGNLGLQEFAMPYYSKTNITPKSQNIIVFDHENKKIAQANTMLLTDTNLLAMKALTEQYPAIITREIIRLIFKATTTYQLNKVQGLAGLIAGSVYSFITSKADLRSWLLLPNNVQVYEKLLPQGVYHVRINNHSETIKINPQKSTLIWVTDMGQFFNVQVYQL